MVTVSILDDVEDIVVQSARREGVANGEQCVHPIGSLVNLITKMISCRLDTGCREVYLVILVTSCMVLSHSEDKIQNLHKDTDRVWVAAQRDVAESYIIIGRDMTGGNASEGILLIDRVSTA